MVIVVYSRRAFKRLASGAETVEVSSPKDLIQFFLQKVHANNSNKKVAFCRVALVAIYCLDYLLGFYLDESKTNFPWTRRCGSYQGINVGGSATRLDYFERSWAPIFLSKVAQISGNFLGQIEECH